MSRQGQFSFDNCFGNLFPTLKKILEREDQYLYVARRTFTNLSLGVPNLHRAVSNLNNEILPKKADISLVKISICFLA
jgi:hypothetical protein